MNLYLLARSSHIFAMFLTFALIIGVEPLFMYAARAGTLEEMKRRYRVVQHLLQLSQLTTMVGLLAALAMLLLAGWSPFAPWLVATYGLLVLMSVVGSVGAGAWQRQLHGLMGAQAGITARAAMYELLVDRRALVARWAIIAIFLLIMIVMREKPSFGW
jgi:uncharacterized membrane protein